MPAAEDVAAWLRYFARREAEGFGPVDAPLSVKRARVLGYVQRVCPEAHAVLDSTTQAVRAAA